MPQEPERDGPPTRRDRPSTKLLFPRVLVIGTESHLRGQVIALLRARGIKAEPLDSGIGAMQKIGDEGLNTVLVMDQIDAMSQEKVVQLLRSNARTKDVGIIAFVDPRADPPEGIDKAFGKGTLSEITDLIVEVCERRASR